jgi:predicted  nucleic acid-binding Zn-ribbon protein
MDELNSLADLLDLQDVDSEIDRLLNRRQSLPELEEYRTAAQKADGIAAELESTGTELRDVARSLDRAEGELAIHQNKREVEERRLYAGGLGARETDHLRQEVQMLTRQASEMEDRTLELMEAREQLEAKVADLAAREEAARAEQATAEAVVVEIWKEIDADIARKEVRKAAIVPLVPADLLELYEELRPSKEGVAAARLAEGVCGGCHLRLSAAEQVQVKRDHPPRCLHCLRILVPQ